MTTTLTTQLVAAPRRCCSSCSFAPLLLLWLATASWTTATCRAWIMTATTTTTLSRSREVAKFRLTTRSTVGGSGSAANLQGRSNVWMQLNAASTGSDGGSSSSSSSATASSTQYTLDGEPIRGPITPLGNFCLVKTKDTLTATEGGILLPDQSKERPTEGVVLAAGPGKIHPHTGVRIVNPVKEGDSVLYGKFDGQPIVYNDEQCQLIRDDDVLLYYSSGVSMSLNNVVPCRDYVLVELSQEQMETSSGIIVAAQVTKEDIPCEGVVVKVGEGRMASKGQLTKSPVQEGERVKFKDYAGNDVMIGGNHYSVVRMVDILCSMPPEEGKKQNGE